MGSLWTTEDKTSALICNKPSLDMVNSNIFLDFSINYHYLSLVGNCHCLKKTVLATFFVERLTDRFVTWTCSDHKTAEPSKVMFATVLFKFINVRMSGGNNLKFRGVRSVDASHMFRDRRLPTLDNCGALDLDKISMKTWKQNTFKPIRHERRSLLCSNSHATNWTELNSPSDLRRSLLTADRCECEAAVKVKKYSTSRAIYRPIVESMVLKKPEVIPHYILQNDRQRTIRSAINSPNKLG